MSSSNNSPSNCYNYPTPENLITNSLALGKNLLVEYWVGVIASRAHPNSERQFLGGLLDFFGVVSSSVQVNLELREFALVITEKLD